MYEEESKVTLIFFYNRICTNRIENFILRLLFDSSSYKRNTHTHI